MSTSGIAIDLKDGEPRTLQYRARWLMHIEREGAKSIWKLLAQDVQLSFELAVPYLWAGLRPSEPKLTMNDAADLIDGYCAKGGTLSDLVVKLLEGLHDAGFLGTKNGAENAEAPPAGDPTRAPSPDGSIP